VSPTEQEKVVYHYSDVVKSNHQLFF